MPPTDENDGRTVLVPPVSTYFAFCLCSIIRQANRLGGILAAISVTTVLYTVMGKEGGPLSPERGGPIVLGWLWHHWGWNLQFPDDKANALHFSGDNICQQITKHII